MQGAATSLSRRFEILLIKPSHYDDDGYVIRWFRSTMPSNSLATVNALACGAARRQILGPEVEIVVTPIDETNARVPTKTIISRFKKNQCLGFVGLVGVQSNEFPRAMDIARPLLEAGVNVIIGGFHVSGCLAMLPEPPDDIKEAMRLGATLFVGECENQFDQLIHDVAANALHPVYNCLNEQPDIATIAAPPFLTTDFVKRTVGTVTSFDAGRGCPYQCTFCTIINVQGRKSRARSPDSVEQIIRTNFAQGVDRFFITDDNFARNKDWEAIYDRIIRLREEEGLDVRFMIQVDALSHQTPNFVEKSKRAGVTRVFIGLENINPDNLLAVKKRQNKKDGYKRMLLAWKAVGIMTFAGYIIGLPNDTPDSIARDIEIIKDELPVDALEFFVLTPLPGSEDHKTLAARNAAMDADMNRYDLEHVVTAHPKMSPGEWREAYRKAWSQFYTAEHMEKILRRAHASGIDIARLMLVLLWFSSAVPLENVHPLQAGLFRRKNRLDRRPGEAMEPLLPFCAKYASGMIRKNIAFLRRWRSLDAIRRKIVREDPLRTYLDNALTPEPDARAEDLRLCDLVPAAASVGTHDRNPHVEFGSQ